jgi:hypothetical protein
VAKEQKWLCSSARPSDSEGAVFGVVTGSVDAPEVRYLRRA